MCAWKRCTFFLELFGAAGCRSVIHAPFSRCNPFTVSFWLCSAKDCTWGMAAGSLINSCFQVTATQSLYRFPRVLLSMCRKLRASENSINFIIFGEKILQVEQTKSHWRTMGPKGRNEICEHSFGILMFLYCYGEFRTILLPSLSLIFTKLPDSLLEDVQPVFSVHAAWITGTAGSCCAAKSPSSTWDSTPWTLGFLSCALKDPGSNLLHLLCFWDMVVMLMWDVGRSLPFAFGELFSHQFLWVSKWRYFLPMEEYSLVGIIQYITACLSNN